MRVMQTIFSSNSFRDISANETRFKLIKELLSVCKSKNVDLLILPAGVITFKSDSEKKSLVTRLKRLAKQYNSNIIGGLDNEKAVSLSTKGKNGNEVERLVKKGMLPYFGFAVGEDISGVKYNTWRQLHTRNDKDQPKVEIGGNIVKFKNKLLGVFLCGELFSKKARTKLSDLKPDIIIDIAHSGMGTGVVPAFQGLSKNMGTGTKAKPVIFHSQHIKNKSGKLMKVSSCGENKSTLIKDSTILELNASWVAYNIENTH